MPVAIERDFSTEKRTQLAKKGAALPDGSFPIENCGDVANAVKAVGRASNPESARRHIIKRARAIGCTDNLPDDWTGGKVATESIRGKETMVAVEATDFDDEKMQAIVTIVKPGMSVNHRNHTAPAIRRAVEKGIWDNSPMFLDHPSDKKLPFKRSIKDLVSITGKTFLGDDGSAKAPVRFINQEFYGFAKEAKDHIGLSMVTLFQGSQTRRNGVLYEEVEDYKLNVSVDWVAFPGAGGAIDKFLSAFESEENVDWSDLTAEQIKEHAPDVYAEILATESVGDDPSGAPTPPKGGSAPAGATPDQVQKMIDVALESAHDKWEKERDDERQARSKITEFVNKAGLPQRMRNNVIDELSEKGSFDEKLAQEAVDTAWEVLKDAGLPGPKIQGAGPSGAQPPKEKDERDQVAVESGEYRSMLALESAFGMEVKASD